MAYNQSKDYEAALGELDQAAMLDPKDADIRFARGAAYLRMGKVDAARSEFLKALELDPKHTQAKHNLDLIQTLKDRATSGEVEKD